MIAFVFGEIASASIPAFASYVPSSTSTTTGLRLFWIIGFTVVGKPIAKVKTSSPGLSARSPSFGLVSPERATKFALDPLLTKSALRAPTNFANCRSNSSVNLPAVSQPSSDASTRAA